VKAFCRLEITGGIAIGADKDDYRVADLTLLRPGSQPHEPTARSGLIEFGPEQLYEQLDWRAR
jgi:hypothetical protein